MVPEDPFKIMECPNDEDTPKASPSGNHEGDMYPEYNQFSEYLEQNSST
jgi:hypothetical protein